MIPLIIALITFSDYPLHKLLYSLVVSILAMIACIILIPRLKHYTEKADIFGIDLNKPGEKSSKPRIPEAAGIITSIVFLIACTQIEAKLEYSSGLLAITFMILLGFVDDTVDLRWKYKLILPLVTSVPLITSYQGVTHIVLPIPFRPIFGKTLELGILYKVYMSMIAIFCSNSINIHAGINGLEVGQSIVIASAIMIHNILEINLGLSEHIVQNHVFSLTIILPFLFTSLALFKFNK